MSELHNFSHYTAVRIASVAVLLGLVSALVIFAGSVSAMLGSADLPDLTTTYVETLSCS